MNTTVSLPLQNVASQNRVKFDEDHVLHELKHFLPSQQALKDFIHHNSLHAFQHMKFYDAIFKASKIFGFQVHLQLPEYRELYKTGRIRADVLRMVIADKKHNVDEWQDKLLNKEYDTINRPRINNLRQLWKDVYHLDLDNKVHPFLFRILCAFLDQGISIQSFPIVGKPFIESIKELESKSPVSFFKTKAIKQKFIAGDYSIFGLLKTIVGRKNTLNSIYSTSNLRIMAGVVLSVRLRTIHIPYWTGKSLR